METITHFIVVFLGVCLYFLPALLALQRRKKNAGRILLINLLLGWTVLVWVFLVLFTFLGDEDWKRYKKKKRDSM